MCANSENCIYQSFILHSLTGFVFTDYIVTIPRILLLLFVFRIIFYFFHVDSEPEVYFTPSRQYSIIFNLLNCKIANSIYDMISLGWHCILIASAWGVGVWFLGGIPHLINRLFR